MFFGRVGAAVMFSFTLACGGGTGSGSADGGSASKDAGEADVSVANAADLPDPCALVTDKEVSDLLWQGMEANQRTAQQARNAQHVFEKRGETVDFPPGRTCYFQHKLVADGTTWSEGDFRLRTLARQAFDIFAQSSASSQAPISGVGDQAFYMSNAAYGRRGDVGVEVVEFGSKDYQIALLKTAVGRLP